MGNRRNLGQVTFLETCWKRGNDLYQVEVQLLMQEELQSLSNFNRSLNLGFTQAEVDEALAGLEEMEKELMEEWWQALLPDEQPEDELLGVALVCPVCKRGRLNQVSTSQVILFEEKCIPLGDRML